MNEPVFHPLAGRSNCLGCHGTGGSGAPLLPGTHDGMTSASCLSCHPPALHAASSIYWVAFPLLLVFALGLARLFGRPRSTRPAPAPVSEAPGAPV